MNLEDVHLQAAGVHEYIIQVYMEKLFITFSLLGLTWN